MTRRRKFKKKSRNGLFSSFSTSRLLSKFRRRTRKISKRKGTRIKSVSSKDKVTGSRNYRFKGWFVFGLIALIILFIFTNFIGGLYRLISLDLKKGVYTEAREEWKGDDYLNILFLGIDRTEGKYGFIDYLSVVSVYPDEKTIGIMNVNVDIITYIDQKDNNYKIRNLYNLGVYQTEDERMQYVVNGIENLLAVDIDRYLLLDEESSLEIFQAIGGAYINNPSEFADSDLIDGNGHIFSLQEGGVGLGSIDLVNIFRTDEPDSSSRLNRQNKALEGIFRRVSSVKIFFRFNDIIIAIEENLQTDLTVAELRRVVFALLTVDEFREGYTTEESLVVSEEGFYYTNTDKIDRTLREVFGIRSVEREQARVEVFNATAVNGRGARVSRKLKNLGYDVIRVGNTSIKEQENIIYVSEEEEFKNSINMAKKIFKGDLRVENELPKFVSTGDIVIIIGKE